MVAQMSKKSKIYHRPGCRFINRIEEDSLVTFDFEDGRIEDLQPCKCCCTLKALYTNYKENLRLVFEDLPISTEFKLIASFLCTNCTQTVKKMQCALYTNCALKIYAQFVLDVVHDLCYY